jgi:hypothetical protein
MLTRVAIGLLFFLSGRSKLFVPQRREQMRQQLIEAHVLFQSSTLCSSPPWNLGAACCLFLEH